MAHIERLKKLREAVENFADKRFDWNHFPVRIEKSKSGCALYAAMEAGMVPIIPRYRDYLNSYGDYFEIEQRDMRELFGVQDSEEPTKGKHGKARFLERLDAYLKTQGA